VFGRGARARSTPQVGPRAAHGVGAWLGPRPDPSLVKPVSGDDGGRDASGPDEGGEGQDAADHAEGEGEGEGGGVFDGPCGDFCAMSGRICPPSPLQDCCDMMRLLGPVDPMLRCMWSLLEEGQCGGGILVECTDGAFPPCEGDGDCPFVQGFPAFCADGVCIPALGCN
jgi:hypothetical protein